MQDRRLVAGGEPLTRWGRKLLSNINRMGDVIPSWNGDALGDYGSFGNKGLNYAMNTLHLYPMI